MQSLDDLEAKQRASARGSRRLPARSALLSSAPRPRPSRAQPNKLTEPEAHAGRKLTVLVVTRVAVGSAMGGWWGRPGVPYSWR